MPKTASWLRPAIVALLLVPGTEARAQGLIGSVVHVTANYPDVASVYSDPGTRTVTAAVEYPPGSYPTYNPSWQVDITPNQFILTNTTSGFPFGVATFNGFVLKVLSGPTILSATADATSDFSPVGITVVNGNEIRINYQGVNHPNDVARSRVNIEVARVAAVPEPSALSLAGLGIALLAGTGWWRRRGTAAA